MEFICYKESDTRIDFENGNLVITDEELLGKLARAPKGKISLEADVRPMEVAVSDKKYNRPVNLVMSILAEALVGFIFKAGAPKEVKASNVIVEAALKQICEICKIKLLLVLLFQRKSQILDLFRQWNSRIRDKDEVVVLGDLSLGTGEETNVILRQLRGRICLIEGNHDSYLTDRRFDRSRLEWVKPYAELRDNKRKVVLCHYPIICYNGQYRMDETRRPARLPRDKWIETDK